MMFGTFRGSTVLLAVLLLRGVALKVDMERAVGRALQKWRGRACSCCILYPLLPWRASAARAALLLKSCLWHSAERLAWWGCSGVLADGRAGGQLSSELSQHTLGLVCFFGEGMICWGVVRI